jgi:nucleoside-diphosphate-sugar epimerase
MRVFLAGGSGAIGHHLVPALVAAGHTVSASTRTREKFAALTAAGAEPVLMDGLDAASVRTAVGDARPDVVIHQLTALTSFADVRHVSRGFAMTNRLRTEGTDNLLAAARAAGVSRFIAQSFTGWPLARVGGPVKTEDDPLDDEPPAELRTTLDAIRYLEAVVTGATDMDGLVLRYGGFYGPHTSIAPGGEQAEMLRKRKLPLVGNGAGIWSLVHIADAAAATVTAVDHGAPGIYQIVDDDPAPVREWLPVLAEAVGAKPPMHVPAWLARMIGGRHTVIMMTEQRGASNAKAKRDLGWTPRYPSWREGFRDGLVEA